MNCGTGCGRPLTAAVAQYTALSDGQKRRYTDRDALPDCGSSRILSPKQVSYCNLYVNGVLQPPVNYRVTEGLLVFTTEDLPIKDASIVLEFVTFFAGHYPARAANDYYIAKASSCQKLFCNGDALPKFSTGGIPSPR